MNQHYVKYESNGDRNENLLVKECLDKIKLYLKHFITDLLKSGTWEIQLKTAINFISCKGSDEEQVIHLKSDNIEVMANDNANEVIREIFESLLSRYQIGLETSMNENKFKFEFNLTVVLQMQQDKL